VYLSWLVRKKPPFYTNALQKAKQKAKKHRVISGLPPIARAAEGG
jgi:hypothetical protein